MTTEILVLPDVLGHDLDVFRPAFTVHFVPTREAERAAIAAHAGSIRAVVTTGLGGFTAAQMDELPNLEIICCMAVGYENIDRVGAARRNIVLTHGRGVNDACVADHAMALLLATVRQIPAADRVLHAGGWEEARLMLPQVSGKRLGILGLGSIGTQVARRAAGFDLAISYHNRRPREGVPYTYADSPVALARDVDYLVACTPGGAGTRHLVNHAVLEALGPAGFLVNVGRGSVVDTAALVDCLRGGRLGGAALDVFEDEPGVPEALRGLPNLVLTAHVAGNAPEVMTACARAVRHNLDLHFAGKPVATPLPAV